MKATTKSSTSRPVKVEGYNSDTLHAKRDKRSREADRRQAVYDGLTIPQKLALAGKRRGESKRERQRLTAKLTANQAANQ